MAEKRVLKIPFELDETTVSRYAPLESIFIHHPGFMEYFVGMKSKEMKTLLLEVIELLSETNHLGNVVEKPRAEIKKRLIDEWNKERKINIVKGIDKSGIGLKVRHATQLDRVLEKLVALKLIKEQKKVVLGKRSSTNKKKESTFYMMDFKGIASHRLGTRKYIEQYITRDGLELKWARNLLDELAQIDDVKKELYSKYGTDNPQLAFKYFFESMESFIKLEEESTVHELEKEFEYSCSGQYQGFETLGKPIRSEIWNIIKKKC